MKRLSKKIFSIIILFVAIACTLFSVTTLKPSSDNFSYAESQQQTSIFLQNLKSQSSNLPISYNISNDYVIDSENQLTTDFCWLFSSLKCLETAYMFQQGMQYNFSETAMAYLNFVSKKDNGQVTYNAMGNMLTFLTLAKQYGLVFENNVSNDYLLDIDESNYKNYSYISDIADKNLSNGIEVVSFGENYTFLSESYYNKIMLMKKFIKNYGALFLAFDDSDGILYQTSTGIPEYSKSVDGHEGDTQVQISRHAVCLIGWDNNGFIALNSWGKGNDHYETFNIPYDNDKTGLENLMKTVRGFVVDAGENVAIENSSNKALNNLFEYGEKIQLSYNVIKNVEFGNLRVKIFKGSEDVTYNFNVVFDNINSKIKIEDKFSNETMNSGGYTIAFYENDNVFARDSFLMLSGTEISSVILEKYAGYGLYETDYVSLNNSYLSNNQTATFTISPFLSYLIKFELSGFSKCTYNASDPEWNNFKTSSGADKLFNVTNIRVLNVSGQSSSWSETSLTVAKYIDYDTNTFLFQLPEFTGVNAIYQNKLIAFDVTLNSTKYNNEKNTTTIMCFVTKLDGTSTNQNYAIYYDLDGGKNSNENIRTYPNYQTNSGMTNFVLKSPTKSGYQFLGWYSDKTFTKQIFVISSLNIGDLCLYARWDTADIDEYVDAFIEIQNIKDTYNDTYRTNNEIFYRDIITFNYSFTKQTALAGLNYSARLIAYITNGSQKNFIESLNGIVLNSDIIMAFDIGYPDINSGNYKIVINAIITINNISIIESVSEYSFEVKKRDIYLSASDFEFVYDGSSHLPNIIISGGDIFEDEQQSITLNFSLSSCINAGDYTISVYLTNNYYKLADDTKKSYNFKIKQKQLNIIWGENEIEFAAANQTPKFNIKGLVGDDVASISLKNTSYYSVGSYIAEIDVNSVTNKNYFVNESSFSFKIVPAKITITLDDKTDKLSVAPKYRQNLTYSIDGNIFNGKSDSLKQQIVDMLNLLVSSDGISATTFGKYDIVATISNDNFDAKIINATYKITAPYKVFYKLPDASIIEEQVEEGQQPKGLTRKDYGYTIFQKLEYSQSLYGDGTSNLHITVTVKDYTYYVVIGSVIVAFVGVYLFITRKQRHNKVS